MQAAPLRLSKDSAQGCFCEHRISNISSNIVTLRRARGKLLHLDSRPVNYDLHATSLRLWKDRCFTATLEGVYFHGLWTMTCTLLHCDSGRIVAPLRLWKEPSLHSLRAKTFTLRHCGFGLNPRRTVVSLRLWKESTLHSL